MNNHITMELYKTFQRRGFATLRFNSAVSEKAKACLTTNRRTIGRRSALDWVQSFHPEASTTWVAGFGFGAWIGMQLLMRRPEIRGFVSIAPPANMFDFTFSRPALPAGSSSR